MDFPFFQIALTRSIFELEKCTFFSNRSKFRQKLIGNVISELRRQNGYSARIKNEDNLKNDDDLKNEDDFKKEDDLKQERNLRN